MDEATSAKKTDKIFIELPAMHALTCICYEFKISNGYGHALIHKIHK